MPWITKLYRGWLQGWTTSHPWPLQHCKRMIQQILSVQQYFTQCYSISSKSSFKACNLTHLQSPDISPKKLPQMQKNCKHCFVVYLGIAHICFCATHLHQGSDGAVGPLCVKFLLVWNTHRGPHFSFIHLHFHQAMSVPGTVFHQVNQQAQTLHTQRITEKYIQNLNSRVLKPWR